MTVREVTFSHAFVAKAHEYYPPDGSTEGRPRFDQFKPLMKAVEFALGRGYDQLQELAPDVRVAITVPLVFFPPIVFYGKLQTSQLVEVLDFEPDATWFEMIAEYDQLDD